MLCYWGAQVRDGFELVQPDKIKHGKRGLRSVCPKTAVQDMSAGQGFVGFIRDGKVWVMKLRSGDSDRDGKLRELQLKDKIRQIVCGGAGVVLLSYGGKVLFMDKSTVYCRPFISLDKKQVIQIACGDHHSMALTKDSQLFVWGENSHGQLGLKKDHPGSPSAQHVESLSGIPVAQISAGGDHSFVLSLSGVVFGWGKNSAGQLGLGDTTDRHVPTAVNSLNQKKTLSISCGGEHTATLSKGGVVFTFGSGGSGQLGHNSFKDEHYPRVVAELWGSKVSHVTCGRRHTLVSITSSKLIYSFGCWIQGNPGNSKTIKKSVPFPVDLSSKSNHEYTIEKLVAGENHSFALFFKELGNESAKSKPSPRKGILTLNDRMFVQWVSEGDFNKWPAIKTEIKQVFSYAACLNGSFLKASNDEQDFELAEKAFSKLFEKENEKVILKVVKVVKQMLRSLNPNPTGEESLRLYTLLPELIRHFQKQQRVELAEALASKILQLNPDVCKVIEMYWFELPDDRLKSLVKLFRKASAELIGQISRGKINQDINHLENFLQILQRIKQVCCSANRDIPDRDFIVFEINDLLDTLQVTIEEDIRVLKNYYIRTIKTLFKFPFAADTVSKRRMFRFLQDERIRQSPDRFIFEDSINRLCINRESVLTKTLEYLRQNTHSFFHRLKVTFIGENGVDIRGLSAEFFSLLSESLLNWEKKVLEVHESSLVWFNLDNMQDDSDFYYLGIICGMALYNHHYLNLHFPLALFRKLLKLSPTLNDLEELSPVEARSLKSLLEEDEDEVVDMLFLDFMVKGEELIPNGNQIPVTKANRQKYVDLYVDFVFNKSVKKQFEHFSEGFSKGCPVDFWSVFHPEELQELLHGSPKYEWSELQQCASYESCSASHELIKNFWTVFFELSEENKRKFLMFLYGTDRVPVGGFSKRSLKIFQSDCPDAEDRFPEAQTCFGRLILPKYSDMDTLRNKLIHAISFCEVFGGRMGLDGKFNTCRR
ncbi:LOW QUALITY PROTEIN: probable E3 ubiquitin-protein ligase HERC4 [Labeo rohita]|uniref:LOW QUALITY PROTEIN: probable E3 ubiquitin-protein ligase HERC4 n=1 Tax=Labeo rohita TaxID=84645 RepID=UPI0021E2CF14|nr:LOW QUALITY PROTEIN: probable E3 ubiquitin-protein ligase HERC4 [Labeo rohita]